MGEDFLATIRHRYKRSIESRVGKRLDTDDLFKPRQQESVSYPCALNNVSCCPEVGRRVFLREDESGIQVMDQQRVIGVVLPEVMDDLRSEFVGKQESQGIVEAEVTAAYPDSNRIEASPIIDRRSRN
jgi:hypothetical protein